MSTLIRSGMIAGVVTAIALHGARLAPDIVERVYSGGVYPPLAETLAAATGWLPFSITDAVFIGLALFVLVIAPVAGFRRTRRVTVAVGAMLGALGAVWAAFVVLWGFNYARPDIAELLALGDPPSDAQTLAILGESSTKTNALRAALRQDDHGCVVLEPPLAMLSDQVRALEETLLARLGLPVVRGGQVKVRPLSRLALHFGGGGIYGPFTGEANLSRPSPPGMMPLDAAHERAHYAGFASEDAANLIGMLALWQSPDAELSYSGWLGLWSLLPDGVVGAQPLSTAVRRDLACIDEFWAARKGAGAETAAQVYGEFLKAQGVVEGIASYERGAQLALRYLAADLKSRR